MKIGFMGATGSFSEQASKKYQQEMSIAESSTIVPLLSADGVLRALTAGGIDRGIFPIENSNGGIVIEAVHAMADYQFQIERMFDIDVHHMLLVQPGVTASAIDTICSHDQALKQCRMYIKRTWPGADMLPYSDTAQAAADLASQKIGANTAIIAPRQCAQLYGLQILEESIQDLKYNYTTFVVAGRKG